MPWLQKALDDGGGTYRVSLSDMLLAFLLSVEQLSRIGLRFASLRESLFAGYQLLCCCCANPAFLLSRLATTT